MANAWRTTFFITDGNACSPSRSTGHQTPSADGEAASADGVFVAVDETKELVKLHQSIVQHLRGLNFDEASRILEPKKKYSWQEKTYVHFN